MNETRSTPRPTLVWIDDGEAIKAVPIPEDPVRTLRGCAKGEGLGQRLREVREAERIGAFRVNTAKGEKKS